MYIYIHMYSPQRDATRGDGRAPGQVHVCVDAWGARLHPSYIYTYVYIHAYVHMYIHTHTYIYKYMNKYIYV